jgi:hypothetical protein
MSFTFGMSYVYHKTDPPRTARTGPTLHRHPGRHRFPELETHLHYRLAGDIRVPMREIQLSPTLIGGSKDNPQYEDNEAVPVYDTSGPYGDPDVAINVQQGLAKLRQPWIDARNDCEELNERSSRTPKSAWPTTVWTSCALPAC